MCLWEFVYFLHLYLSPPPSFSYALFSLRLCVLDHPVAVSASHIYISAICKALVFKTNYNWGINIHTYCATYYGKELRFSLTNSSIFSCFFEYQEWGFWTSRVRKLISLLWDPWPGSLCFGFFAVHLVATRCVCWENAVDDRECRPACGCSSSEVLVSWPFCRLVSERWGWWWTATGSRCRVMNSGVTAVFWIFWRLILNYQCVQFCLIAHEDSGIEGLTMHDHFSLCKNFESLNCWFKNKNAVMGIIQHLSWCWLLVDWPSALNLQEKALHSQKGVTDLLWYKDHSTRKTSCVSSSHNNQYQIMNILHGNPCSGHCGVDCIIKKALCLRWSSWSMRSDIDNLWDLSHTCEVYR